MVPHLAIWEYDNAIAQRRRNEKCSKRSLNGVILQQAVDKNEAN